MLELVGWTGAILFALCGVPQALKVWRTHQVRDLSWVFLLMWLSGEILTFIYVLANNAISGELQLPLLTNYVFNTIILMYLVWAKRAYKNNQSNS